MEHLKVKDLQKINTGGLRKESVITAWGVPIAYLVPVRVWGGLHVKLDEVLEAIKGLGVPKIGGESAQIPRNRCEQPGCPNWTVHPKRKVVWDYEEKKMYLCDKCYISHNQEI